MRDYESRRGGILYVPKWNEILGYQPAHDLPVYSLTSAEGWACFEG